MTETPRVYTQAELDEKVSEFKLAFLIKLGELIESTEDDNPSEALDLVRVTVASALAVETKLLTPAELEILLLLSTSPTQFLKSLHEIVIERAPEDDDL